MNESVLTGPVHFGDNVCTKVKVVRGGEFISRKKKEEKKKNCNLSSATTAFRYF